jgi:tetratricopeptide (TPR) repeat protein
MEKTKTNKSILFLLLLSPAVTKAGIYRDISFYIFELLVYMIAFLCIIITFRKKYDSITILKTPLDYLFFAVVCLYGLNIICSINLHSAISEFNKYVMYLLLFAFFSYLVKSYRTYLLKVFYYSGFLMCFIGLDSFYNSTLIKIINIPLGFISPLLEIKTYLFNNRMGSIIEYANTLGMYLAVIYFIGLYINWSEKKLAIKCITFIINILLLTGLFLTSSRGVLLVLPVVLVFIFILLKPIRTLKLNIIIFMQVCFGVFISWLIKSNIFASSYVNIALIIMSLIIFTAIYRFILKVDIAIRLFHLKFKKTLFILTGIVLIVCFFINKPLKLQPLETYSKIVTLNNNSNSDYSLSFQSKTLNSKRNAVFTVKIKSGTKLSKFDEDFQESKETMEFAPKNFMLSHISIDVDKIKTKKLKIDIINESLKNPVIIKDIVLTDSNNKTRNIFNETILIPNIISKRFRDILNSSTFIERLTMYTDGLKIGAKNILWGNGGGGWRYLYRQIQNYPYVSTNPHSFLIETLISIGIVGLLVILFFIYILVKNCLYLYKKFIDEDKNEAFLITVISSSILMIIIHSIVDLNMSFGLIFILFLFLVSIINSRIETKKLPGIRLFWALFIIVPCFYLSFTFLYGTVLENKYNKYFENKDFIKALSTLEKATKTDPFMARYKINYGTLLIRKKGISESEFIKSNEIIEDALNLSDYHSENLVKIAGFYTYTRKPEKAMALVDRAIELFPLWKDGWEYKSEIYKNMGSLYFQNNNFEKAKATFIEIVNLDEKFKEMNKDKKSYFIFSRTTFENIEKCNFLLDGLMKNKKYDDTKLVFKSLPRMDINNNNEPDQWNKSSEERIKISFDEITNNLILNKTRSFYSGFSQSRNIFFLPGRNYKLLIKVSDESDFETFPVKVTGITETAFLVFKNNIAVLDFETDNDFKPYFNVIQIDIEGKYVIEDILLLEIN